MQNGTKGYTCRRSTISGNTCKKKFSSLEEYNNHIKYHRIELIFARNTKTSRVFEFIFRFPGRSNFELNHINIERSLETGKEEKTKTIIIGKRNDKAIKTKKVKFETHWEDYIYRLKELNLIVRVDGRSEKNKPILKN